LRTIRQTNKASRPATVNSSETNNATVTQYAITGTSHTSSVPLDGNRRLEP